MSKIIRLRGKWYRWVGYGFGLGLSPVAPGTLGTLLGIPIVILFQFLPDLLWFLGTLLVALISVSASSRISSEVGLKDHPAIVIDEVAGFVVTMMLIPITPLSIMFGFLLFRLFDIFKPPPVNWIDRKVPGGIGITVDDLAAGLYANVVLQMLLKFTELL